MDATTQLALVVGLEQTQGVQRKQFLKEFSAQHPEDRAAIREIADCYHDFPTAEECLRQTLGPVAVQIQPTLFKETGTQYFVTPITKTARELEAIVAADPDDAVSRLMLVHALVGLGGLDRASDQLDSVEKQIGEDVNTLFLRGKIAYGRTEYAAAATYFHRAYDTLPIPEVRKYYVASSNTEANFRALAGDSVAAVAIWEELIQLVPENRTIAINLGQAYLATGNKSAAIDVYEKLLEQYPEDETLLAYYDEAITAPQDQVYAISAEIDQMPLMPLKSIAYDPAQAQALIDSLDDWQDLVAVANAAIKNGGVDDAIKALDKALAQSQACNGVPCSPLQTAQVKTWLSYAHLSAAEGHVSTAASCKLSCLTNSLEHARAAFVFAEQADVESNQTIAVAQVYMMEAREKARQLEQVVSVQIYYVDPKFVFDKSTPPYQNPNLTAKSGSHNPTSSDIKTTPWPRDTTALNVRPDDLSRDELYFDFFGQPYIYKRVQGGNIQIESP